MDKGLVSKVNKQLTKVDIKKNGQMTETDIIIWPQVKLQGENTAPPISRKLD